LRNKVRLSCLWSVGVGAGSDTVVGRNAPWLGWHEE
jgi:hypothetical protein